MNCHYGNVNYTTYVQIKNVYLGAKHFNSIHKFALIDNFVQNDLEPFHTRPTLRKNNHKLTNRYSD